MTKRYKKSTAVQSVLFDKTKWTTSKARAWLRSHGHKTPKPDTTSEYHRYRQEPPFRFKAGTFRQIDLGAKKHGIKAVIAVPRDSEKNAKPNKNPTAKKRAIIPQTLVDLATPIEIELDDDRVLRFPLRDNWALCSTQSGNQLWIVSRHNGKRVSVKDKEGHDLYERFTGFEHEDAGTLINNRSRKLERIGRAINITYRSDKFARPGKNSDYIHAFEKYPAVSVDNIKDPRIVAIRGGAINVKMEGITG